MPSTKRKVQLLAAFTVLLLFAFGAGCRGFFVNSPLVSIMVFSTATQTSQGQVLVGQSLQMGARGTNQDGQVISNIPNLAWSSSPTSVATINSSGLLTGVAVGITTVTASSAGISGTATVNVVVGNVIAIVVSPSTNQTTIGQTPANYTAMATTSGGGQTDITGSATWSVSQNGTAVTTIQCTFVSPNEQCSAQSGTNLGTYNINVTYPNTTAVGTATLTVN